MWIFEFKAQIKKNIPIYDIDELQNIFQSETLKFELMIIAHNQLVFTGAFRVGVLIVSGHVCGWAREILFSVQAVRQVSVAHKPKRREHLVSVFFIATH